MGVNRIMTLEGLDDLGDEIMVLEGLGASVTPQNVFQKLREGYTPPVDPITVGTGMLFYGSLATAIFSDRFRAPALVMATGAGILQLTRGIAMVQEES